MSVETFTCAECGGTFNKARTDDEARAEAAVHGFDPADCVIVCDDCFQKLMAANDHPIGQPRPSNFRPATFVEALRIVAVAMKFFDRTLWREG